MRYTRLLLPFTLLVSLTVHGQSFESLSTLRLTEETMSVRGLAMGNVSIDDPALDPTALAKLERPRYSLGASRVEYNIFTGFFRPETRNATALSHALVAMPAGDFTVSAHYRATPLLRGDITPGPGGTAAYEPYPCTVQTCLLAFNLGPPIFERRERRYGASVAWERGRLAIGAGAEMLELHQEAAYGRTTFFQFGTPQPEPPRLDMVVRRVEGRELVPNAAVRWTFSPRASVAVAYNGAAKFDHVEDTCTAAVFSPEPHCASEYVRLGAGTQGMADAFRASATIEPFDNVTLVAEAVRRNYRKLDVGDIDAFTAYRDVTELHAGAEYRTGNVALRAGWWRDPARWVTEFIGPSQGMGTRQDHVTLGAGINAGSARIDLAIDDADMPSLRRASIGVTLGARGR